MTHRMIAVCVMMATLAGASANAQQPVPPVRGPEKATDVEVFLSFAEVPSVQASVVLDALVERHPDSVRVVFRHVVAEDNASAVLVHRAAYAAAAQSRFWTVRSPPTVPMQEHSASPPRRCSSSRAPACRGHEASSSWKGSSSKDH